MIVVATLLLAAVPPIEAIAPALTHCTSANPYSREALAQGGWEFRESASLKAPGQRTQSFTKEGETARVTLRSSNVVMVACSASLDLESAEIYPATVEAIVASKGATKTDAGTLGGEAAGFIRANELKAEPLYANGTHHFLFELRQFNGRNLMIIYVFRKG